MVHGVATLCVYQLLSHLIMGFFKFWVCQQDLKALCEGIREQFGLSAISQGLLICFNLSLLAFI